MSKKNRLEQPYGYKEQNKYVSEPAMICNAITSKISIEDMADEIKTIASKSFASVKYVREIESFVFSNAEGTEIGTAKLYDVFVSDLIKKISYNEDTKAIAILFTNSDEIELPLGDIVTLIEDEAKAREDGDNAIWEAIGTLEDSSESGHATIIDMIKDEAKAREDGDNAIWEAIGKLGEDGETISDMITKETEAREEAVKELEEKISDEAKAREEADKELEEKLEGEISAEANTREEADKAIWDAIGDLTESSENGDKTIIDLINEERAAREEGDSNLNALVEEEVSRAKEEEDKLKAIIGDIIDSAESENVSLTDMIKTEKAEREAADNELNEAITAETAARENVEGQLWEAYNSEANVRLLNDNKIQEALEAEVNNRAEVEGQIWTAVSGETERAQAVEGQLWTAITGETARAQEVEGQLWTATNGEAARSQEVEAQIWGALNSEIANREASEEELRNGLASIKIERADAASSNIKEAFKLTDGNGTQLGETINIYKDSSLKDVALVGEKDGNTGQYLKFTYILEDGSEKTELLDVSTFLVESEFKNGLIVESNGEVNVLIDELSEKYLTVSDSGLKLYGIDAIVSDLNSEKNFREAGDTTLETKINSEKIEREAADNDLDKKIASEEKSRQEADNAINSEIESEKTARENGDNELKGAVSAVVADLVSEASTRESKDTELEGEIASLKTEDATLDGKINDLKTELDTEVTNRTSGDNNLQEALAKKANSIDVYYKGEADEKFATKEEIPTDFYGKTYINGQFEAVNNSITAETQNRESEDASLNRMITAETKSRTDADVELQGSIDTINNTLVNKFDTLNSDNLGLTITDNGTSANIKLNISSADGQIIKLNTDGIYANVSLTYDEDLNTLFFKSSGDTETIKLKAKLEINKVYYTRENESITIEYTVNGKRMEDVTFSVASLINEWRVSEDTSGAIKLTKTRELSSEQDVLSAEVRISTSHDDNALVNDGSALYVSKNDIIGDLESRIARLEATIAALSMNTVNINQTVVKPSTNIVPNEEEYIEED